MASMTLFPPARKRSVFSAFVLFTLTALILALGVSIKSQAQNEPATEKAVNAKSIPNLEHKAFPQGGLYVMQIPAQGNYKVIPLVSKTLATVASQVWQNSALTRGKKPLFLINGGFFDPNNSLTTSFIFQGGLLTADPRINPNLVNNPKLVPYLPKIFNRPEFRLYLCQKETGSFQTRYDIALRNDPAPQDCLLQSALGAGPTLLPKVEDFNEGFVDYNPAGKLTRDPIGVCALNARSAVGITEKGDVLIVMATQNQSNPSGSGFNLNDIANLLKARGAVKAMALDGGSSSGFWYEGKAIYGKFTKDGKPVIRPVKSVIMVVPR